MLQPGAILRSIVLALLLGGCATTPVTTPSTALPTRQAIPAVSGSYHQVQRGETLWRIARSYGLTVEQVAAANRISSSTPLAVGQRLFIPLPGDSGRFLWPVLGSVVGPGGYRGVEIAGSAGTLVRASRAGRVVVATRRLAGFGQTVIVDHLDGYLSIYAGMDQLLVTPGAPIRQGTPVGRLGARRLHFEIRHGTQPKNTLALLPQ